MFSKTAGATAERLPSTADYLLWYAKDGEKLEYRQLYREKVAGAEGGGEYTRVELPDGCRIPASQLQEDAANGRLFCTDNMTSQSIGREKGEGAACWFPVSLHGREFRPNENRRWATNEVGMARLIGANRVHAQKEALRYIRYLEDFEAFAITNLWDDTGIAGRPGDKMYVVQTNPKVIERCIQMTTKPGDLVLDCTSGSGTTAYVAEQWGRRWIAIDSSRVAVAIARQRLLTATYDYYKLRDASKGVGGGFAYEKTLKHVTLKSIAQNAKLDPVFAKHAPVLAQRLAALNEGLKQVTPSVRSQLQAKLAEKKRRKDRDDPVTEADERRWLLPKERWEEWEVPFDSDPLWPDALREALAAYRAAWRAKMDEVGACIDANAEQEELVHLPRKEGKILRVSGPFTVEGVQPMEETFEEAPVERVSGELETFEAKPYGDPLEPRNALAHVETMVRLLRQDGVRFARDKQSTFKSLELTLDGPVHAEGTWAAEEGGERRVAVCVGPEHGSVTGKMVEEWLRAAARRGYDELVVAGFAFDAEATAVLTGDGDPAVRTHLAHIRPDVKMEGLLKELPQSQLFTVFGLPRTRVEGDGRQWSVTMEGVDVYDPVSGALVPTGADKVAAWFIDSDYDGRTFCVCQAFFPDKSAWEKLARALRKVVQEGAFERFSGTRSAPFPAGEHRRVAVKVIDPRGNELMSVHALTEAK